jgi:hypothetical protein
MVASLPSHLAGLKSCAGSGDKWNCAGLWKADIVLPDGTALPLVGVPLSPAANPVAVWTQR